MKLKRSEAEIKREIVRYLKAKSYWVFRMNSGSIFIGGDRPRKIAMNPSGTADLLVFRKSVDGYSVPVWIEVKSPSGRQSESQKLFEQLVVKEYHGYILARSVEDVAKVL